MALSEPARVRALEDLRAPSRGSASRRDGNPDHHLFCVQNGVIDLRDGGLRAGLQSDLINGRPRCATSRWRCASRWEQFLLEVFQTEEMVDVQSIIGYCMTGLTTEQVWFLLYGPAATASRCS
jgi:putative DNA primase/helicase